MPPVALQLWSVREATAADFAGTVAQVAAMGYAGVELAGTGNLDTPTAARAVADAGLRVAGMHVGIGALRSDPDRVIDDALRFGATDVTVPSWSRAQFRTVAGCHAIGAELAAHGARLRAHGLRLGFHNHDAEFALLDGRPVFTHLLAAAPPLDLSAQLDVYWAHVGGYDPVRFLREQGERVRSVHLKDEKEIGLGPVNFAPIFETIDALGTVEWCIVEVEAYNHPPLESVRRSLDQLRAWHR